MSYQMQLYPYNVKSILPCRLFEQRKRSWVKQNDVKNMQNILKLYFR